VHDTVFVWKKCALHSVSVEEVCTTQCLCGRSVHDTVSVWKKSARHSVCVVHICSAGLRMKWAYLLTHLLHAAALPTSQPCTCSLQVCMYLCVRDVSVVCAYVYVCARVCMRDLVCTCVYLYECVYVQVCVCVCTYKCVYVCPIKSCAVLTSSAHQAVHTYTHSYIQIHTCLHTWHFTHTSTQVT
jgi:hypothetical protein